jgi:hypothetical protein
VFARAAGTGYSLLVRLAYAITLLIQAGCECATPPALTDGGRDAGMDAWSPPPVLPDAEGYVPRDGGPLPIEPCRDATRRLRFEELPFGSLQRIVGHGDRIAVREVDGSAFRARIFDVAAGREIALTAPLVAPAGERELVAHEGGFDLVGYDDVHITVARVDRDGRALGIDTFTRSSAPEAIVAEALVRTPYGLAVLVQESSSLVLDVLATDGVVRTIPLGSATEHAEIAADELGHLVGAIAYRTAADATARFVRFDVDLATDRVQVTPVGLGPAHSASPGLTAVHVADGVAIAAFALADEVGASSGIRFVWWTPGGAELARLDRERLSVESIAVAGIAGAMPEQSVAYYTGYTGSTSARGYLLAGRVRAPGDIEGGASPLAAGVNIFQATTWEWVDGGVAIAYATDNALEIVLACEGGP